MPARQRFESTVFIRPGSRFATTFLAILILGSLGVVDALASDPTELIATSAWQDPPRETRPMARWWWPGGSVEEEALERQLAKIEAGGFGGVELQPLLLGLGADDLAADPKLRSVGKAGFRKSVAHAAAQARRLGLDFDLTLGSGWPGGLPTHRRNAERELLMTSFDVEGPSQFERALPPPPGQSYRRAVEWILDVLGPPDTDAEVVAVLAGRIGELRDGVPTLDDVRDITMSADAGRLAWSAPKGDWRVFVIYTQSTSHFVMGGAFPGAEADALVVDHLSQRGADALLDGYASPTFEAAPRGSIRGVFVDSFELMGELPFTESFLEQFKSLAGYDLTPHLPLLFRVGGESKYAEMIDVFGRGGGAIYVSPEPGRARRIREDYERVRRLLFEREFVDRFVQWAGARDVEFRLQAHGGYGNYLDTYARADVPEAEGLFGGGSFDFLKLASSAAHVAGKKWASSEAFITLRLHGRQLGAPDMRMLAGRAYSAGINRLVFHGVPYPYQRADGNAWFPFSGGFGRILAGPLPMSFDIDAATLERLPAFNRFLSRLSYMMSLGEPAADIAWLHSDPTYPDTASFQIGRIDPHQGESTTTQALRARGLTYDRVSRRMLAGATVDDGAIRIGATSYRALIVDPLAVAEPDLVTGMAEIAESGLPVFALGELPRRAPGLRDAASRDELVKAASQRLSSRVLRIDTNHTLEQGLAEHLKATPVGPVKGERLDVSIEKRRIGNTDILFLFNESWSPTRASLQFITSGGPVSRWNPDDGSNTELRSQIAEGDVIALDLAPAESIVLTVGH